MIGYIILAVYIIGFIGCMMWAGWEQAADMIILAIIWPVVVLFFILASPYWIMSRIKDQRRRDRRYR